MSLDNKIVLTAPEGSLGERLDVIIAKLCPQFSRSQLQKWIKSGDILLNNKKAKTRDKVFGGEAITVIPVLSEQTHDLPEAIELDIVFEDELQKHVPSYL